MYEFLISKFNGKRSPQRKLSLEQIVALNIYRFHFKMGDLKNYHKMKNNWWVTKFQISRIMKISWRQQTNRLYSSFLLKQLQEKIWTNLWAALNVIISSTEASLNPTGEHWKITFSLNIIRQEVLSVCSSLFL